MEQYRMGPNRDEAMWGRSNGETMDLYIGPWEKRRSICHSHYRTCLCPCSRQTFVDWDVCDSYFCSCPQLPISVSFSL